MPWTLSICANGFAALGTSATKKRENVGILKKKGGGVYPNPTSIFTVFNMGDPLNNKCFYGPKMQNKP